MSRKIFFLDASKHLFWCVVFLMALNSTTFAETYYVSPSGNASWGQCVNINTPCSILTSMANAVAGDIVYLRGGTYMAPVTSSDGYVPAIRPSNSGTVGNPITFKAYEGEIPFIDNTRNQGSSGTVGSFGCRYVDYIVWDGIHSHVVPDSTGIGKGIILYHSNNVTIRNCDVEGNLYGRSNNAPLRIDYCDDLLVENNKFYNSKNNGSPDVNSAGIMLYHTNRCIIQNNDIFNCDIAYYDKADGNYNKIRFNHFWNNSYGISLSIKFFPTTGTEVYQNIIRGVTATYAFEFHDYSESGANNIKVYNNVFYNCNKGIDTKQPSYITGIQIFNNIIYNTGSAKRLYQGAVSYLNYNTYYNVSSWNLNGYGGSDYTNLSSWQSATGFDINSNTNNPNFVNPGGLKAEDYKRNSYSLDGRGGTYASVRGAYITGNEVIGYDDGGASNSVPMNLSAPAAFQLVQN